MVSNLFCLALVLATQYASAAFSWTNCLTGSSAINIQDIQVTPDPVIIPGDVHLKIKGATTRNITRSTLTISLKKKTFLLEVPVPCVGNIGSCTYKDMCTLIDRMENENWDGLSAGIGTDLRIIFNNAGIDPSACPLPPTTLDLADGVLHLPKPNALLSSFSAGDYHFHVTITEDASQEQIFCLDFLVSVDEQCSGLGCFIG